MAGLIQTNTDRSLAKTRGARKRLERTEHLLKEGKFMVAINEMEAAREELERAVILAGRARDGLIAISTPTAVQP